jgi:signal transduction histidine kinase
VSQVRVGRAGSHYLARVQRAAAETPDPLVALAAMLAVVREAFEVPALAVLRVEGQRLVPCAIADAGADAGTTAVLPRVARRRDEVDLVPPGGAVYPLVHGGRVEGVLLVYGAPAPLPAARWSTCAPLLGLLAAGLAYVQRQAPPPGADADALPPAEEAELQERLRALGTMAGTMAHDLNNALSPVLGYVELLMADPDAYGRRPKVRDYLQLVRAGAEDAIAIVTRLRPFYRRREPEDHRQTVAVGAMLEELADQTRRSLADQRPGDAPLIRVEVVVAPDLAPAVGDAGQLQAALTRVLENAAEAMPAGGTIVLAARTGADGGVVLEVRDTGPGMSEVARQRCIEPFFTTKESRGGGLGLSIAYGIARRHGGTLAVHSTPGVGTTVRLRLPAVRPGAS